jgi:signal transduction histidine kinase
MDQVFRNILENSLAACGDPVRIEARWSSAGSGARRELRVSIRDNGPGFTPEARQHVFEPFFTTKTKGTGLGMAIARRLVEAHGGTVEVGAGESRGAEVVITLPAGEDAS